MKRLAVTLVVLCASAVPALACTCAPPAPGLNLKTRRSWAEWRLRNAQVVFEGKVERIEVEGWPIKPEPGKTRPNKMEMLVTFSGVRIYRGSPREQFVVETGLGGGDCGYNFKVGESYLVDAWLESGRLTSGICSGTAPLEDAAPELRLLRGEPATSEDLAELNDERSRVRSHAAPSDKICGKVSFPQGAEPRPITVRAFPVGDLLFPFLGDNVESKADGSFCFDWTGPGKFILGASETEPRKSDVRFVSYYPGVLQRSQATPVELKRGAGVVRGDFTLLRQPLFTVRGYLRGVPRSMVDSIKVFLMSDQLDAFYYVEPEALDPHGAFEIRDVPPGHYTAFAVRENEGEDSTTFLSTVSDVEVHTNVAGLKLEFVAEKK